MARGHEPPISFSAPQLAAFLAGDLFHVHHSVMRSVDEIG